MIDQPTWITRPVSRVAANLENIYKLYKTGEMVEMVESHFKPIVYYDKIAAACENNDHTNSVAKVYRASIDQRRLRLL